MRDPDLSPEQFQRDEIAERVTLFDVQDFGRLEGAVRAGDAFKFSACGRLVLHLAPPCSNLSHFNQLSLTVTNLSEALVLAGLKLVHGHESRAETLEPISFSGGREELPSGLRKQLRFPAEAFGSYGSRDGWADVRGIEIAFGRERTHDGPEEIRVAVTSLDAEYRRIPPGPRLTPAGLSAALRADLTQAPAAPSILRRALMRSPRPPYSSDNPALRIPPPHAYPREGADEILEGKIMGRRLPDPIEWGANPQGMHEWTHFLNRHHFMRELVIGLIERGDDRYARKLDEFLSGWISGNPVPIDSNGGAGSSWETLTAAWRLREWLWVASMACPHRGFRDETRGAMLSSIWEHAQSFLDHNGHPNNWIIVESAALALAGLCFPEFLDADLWARTGIERLQREFRRQFFEDAVHFEISPLYHAICFHALLEVREAAEIRGVPLPKEFHEPLERCTEYLVALCRSNFTWPSLNDAGSADSDYTALLKKAGEVFRRGDLEWIGTRGSAGNPPEATFHVFPHAGIASMRSGWRPDANFLVFRAGPPGAFHAHDDALSLDVAALGAPRLLDPGITTYGPDLLTSHYRSAEFHNMVLVDGAGLDRSATRFPDRVRSAEKALFPFRTDCLDAITGIAGGHGNRDRDQMTVSRTVVFVNGEYWIVRDTVCGKGEHEISTCWQFAPGSIEVERSRCSIRYMDPKGPQLEVSLLSNGGDCRMETFVGSLAPCRGWVSLGGQDIPAAMCVCRLRATLPVTQAWLLFPSSLRLMSGMTGSGSRGADGSDIFEILFPEGGKDVISLSVDGRTISGRLSPHRLWQVKQPKL